MTSYLIYQRNTQVTELINIQIPQIEFGYRYNQLLAENNKISSLLLTSASSNELEINFKLLQNNILKISALFSFNSSKIKRVQSEFDNINETVQRIKSNEARNIELKKIITIELSRLLNILLAQIDQKSGEQASLQQQIAMNGVNGYISAGKANHYIEITRVLQQLNKSMGLLDTSSQSFEGLNISYSIDELDSSAKNIDLGAGIWISVLTDQETINKIEAFKTLLYTEQRALGKWHSHLRLSEEVFERISVLNETLNELEVIKTTDSSFYGGNTIIPPFISKLATKVGIKPTLNQYHYLLMGGLLFSLCMIALILIRVQFRLKKYGINTVRLCESLLSDTDSKSEQGNFIQSSEHLRIVGLIQQIKKPEHSENQYQQLANIHEERSSFLASHHRIIHWRYIPEKEYVSSNKDVLELCDLSHQHIVNWRQLFHKKSIKDIISIAKTVRDSNTTLSCHVITNNDVRMDVLIDFDGKVWSGTIHRNDKVELLQGALKKAKSKLKTAEIEVLEELTSSTDKFSKMVLGAMLQSQGGSIDATGASLQVYRQLTRVLDWCRQSTIVSQLQHNGKTTAKSNINFKDELHAVLLNAMSEIHLQRNQIYLQTDRQLMDFAQVDQRLFRRMLLGVIRIALAELFNAKMLLGLKVIDLDNGMQTIRFTLTVSSAKPLKAIPELVNRLVNEDRKVTSSLDIIFYLRTLMYHLNINDIQTALHDNGFKLFFNAQILMGNEVKSLKSLPVTGNLKQDKILLISGCDFSQQVVSEAVNGLGGVVTTLSHVEELEKQYSQDELAKRAINLIIVGDDVFKEQIENVESFINALPVNIQPQLMVMQAPQGSPLHKVGLYGQASMPLCQRTFQQQIIDLLQSNNKNNRLIEPEILSQFHFLPTRVELLLAVSKPEEHQTLIRILQWLGMQIQIVCQPEAMAKHWQSGRYLVLFSEFTQSPFALLSTGRNVHRGVFTFKEMLFDTPEGNISSVIKNWKVSKLPNILDIKELTSLLEPWLKSNTALVSHNATSKKPELKVQKIQSFDEFLNESEVLNEEDKAYLNQSKIFLPETSELPVDIVFDIVAYARNQGSSELASYMLDEYTQNIQEAIASVESNINEKQFNDALYPLSIISRLSDVMAAPELNKKVIAFKANLDEVIASGNVDKNSADTLKLLKHECQRLIAFSEAI